eukprot:CAMPEP_0176099954 /NCGR_PEP_ID=MMETSP0120_2-20121206/50132_1 /TAXON_ID=160619 /ORGANISM="Kryptoperidinium foliaceum, Strain CCMP 1326" /LENGTH=471 /DNA_ID=CAMNT_0017433997 /DNA_START=30 /DNA_END=1445 /DNA_ORIENTATION=-
MTPEALVLCGPVIGKVTDTSANILLEVDGKAEIVCIATPAAGGTSVSVAKMLTARSPAIFRLQGLLPETAYDITFSGIAVAHMRLLQERGCKVRTFPPFDCMKSLRIIAVSCDYPTRLLDDGATNPWANVASLCKSGDCDVMLHLGDQVYTWENGRMLAAQAKMEGIRRDFTTPEVAQRMELNASRELQESYNFTWSLPEQASALAHSSHLMIWSDNDVTNDFTVLRKPDGSQEYSAEFLTVAMQVYRIYQRSLWDPSAIDVDLASFQKQSELKEWHFHTYGPCGIFFIDMRGNRINADGKLVDGLPPLMSEAQRVAIVEAFDTPGLKAMLLCAEIPFLGPDPVEVQEGAKKLPFLKDHWPYNLDELKFLLDLCFDFKAKEDGREVLLLGGDIHVGVDSSVTDSATGLTIRQITTSPITNSASVFHCPLEGVIGDRYSYKHTPYPSKRNFCTIDMGFEGGKATAKVDLVCV